MADIFLSYARAEREKATRIKEMLEGLGLTVFFDVEGLDGGDVFPDVLDREVKTAGAVVSCWSPHALTRPWVKAECRIGQTRGVLVPVAIEALGDLDVPLEFVGTQYIDLSTPSDGSDAQSMHLVRALARALERPDLLDHEIRAHQQEASSLSSDERAEMEKMRAELDALLAKKQASASFPQPTAEQLKTWDEIKTSTNVSALQRFVAWVDGTPLEHRVRERIAFLEAGEAESERIAFLEAGEAESETIAFLEAGEAEPDTPSGKGRMVVPLVSLMALVGLGVGGYLLDPLGWFGRGDSAIVIPVGESQTGTQASTSEMSANGSRSDASASTGMTAVDNFPVGSSFTDCSGCPEMVVIPSGEFVMGSPSYEPDRDDDEGPQRTVRIGYKFAVGKYEVTWSQWEDCVSAGGCEDNSEKYDAEYTTVGEAGDSGFGRGNRPVINVSWNDAEVYVSWLSHKTGHTYRLLSEAEWEYAARAGTQSAYAWGPSIGRNRANCDTCGSQWDASRTAPVGAFEANTWGLHDMHGNVFEWTQDCWNDSYVGAPSTGVSWQSGDCSSRVGRSGSWFSFPDELRSAVRGSAEPSFRSNDSGFRVARVLED